MRGTSDILGHDTVIEHLWHAITHDNLHHAYLFEGPDGIGKRLVAQRLAMAVNCTAPSSEHPPPCGACASCVQIVAGTHPDVLVLEPEADRATPITTVAQVRELIRKVGYHRYNGKMRVIIVDPIESLPTAAANALLKTLEEPPEGTGFVLIATHPASLLPTILSRCQRVRFSAVPEDQLTGWLQQRGHEPATPLARLAMGRPGVALALAQGALDERRELRTRLLQLIDRPDLGQIFDFSKTLCAGGRASWSGKVELLLSILEDLLRDATIIGSGSDVALMDPEAADASKHLASTLWPTGLPMCVQALDDARASLAANVSGRTVIDALICRISTEAGRLS
ncbi:MAG: DNA polymerase-3 subunit delta' [Kiritimatiellia bacterium]|jgi:DNA polymerase-3 subunit delta'